MVFRIASSPYTHNQRQTSRIMMLVLLAALPGIAAQLWFFGWGTLFQIVLAAISAIAAEAGVLKLRKQPIVPILKDNSALLTGLLLAVSIPPLAPGGWWYWARYSRLSSRNSCMAVSVRTRLTLP